MSFNVAVQLLQEFDYQKNGKEETIYFLEYIIEELKKYDMQ